MLLTLTTVIKIPNKNYNKGANWERKAKAILEKMGYTVYRSAGSHSLADLICFKGEEVRFVQIKTTKLEVDSNNIPKHYLKELDALRTKVCYLGQPYYSAELWIKGKNKDWIIRKYRYTNGY